MHVAEKRGAFKSLMVQSFCRFGGVASVSMPM